MGPHVAVVCRDPSVRADVARLFDRAPRAWRITLHEDIPTSSDVDLVVAGPDMDGVGELTLEPDRPEVALTAIAELLRGRGACIVVTGPRGAGVTTVALHLAALGPQGKSNAYVDCDPSWGARIRLGLADAPGWDLYDGSEDSLRLCAVPFAKDARALLPPRDRQDARPPGEVLRAAGGAFDALILDAPWPVCDETLRSASAVVLVFIPTPEGIRRARSIAAEVPDVPIAFVINRLGAGGEWTPARIQERLGHRIALELPCCPRLRDAEEVPRLLPPGWSRWALRVAALAEELTTP